MYHPYIPNANPVIRRKMLDALGLKDEMEVFRAIPDHLLYKEKLDFPEPIQDEHSIKCHMEELLAQNANAKEYLSFLGAGCARHFVPAVCDEIMGRGEFLTCYGAQAWGDHGRHQALFEYNSLMAELLETDILSNPVYDNAQAMSSAISMACRITGRKKVLLSGSMSRDNRLILCNYLDAVRRKEAVELVFIDYDPETLQIDLAQLQQACDESVAAILIENPNYLGAFEQEAARIGALAASVGAEYIVSVDPICLGVVAPPARYGATITCGDFHSLGLHLLFGGGQGGFIATPDDMRYIREFKDLMYGLVETVVEGEFGFASVMPARTSYGTRERGNEFTGTGTNLWAINVAVYLSIMGPKGMREVGEVIAQNARYAAETLNEIDGVRVRLDTAFFKEFVVEYTGGVTAAQVNELLLKEHIFGGKALANEHAVLGEAALYCATELTGKKEIDRLADCLRKICTGENHGKR